MPLHWFSFTDALQVFGEMLKLERVSVGSVTWASLKHKFLLQQETPLHR